MNGLGSRDGARVADGFPAGFLPPEHNSHLGIPAASWAPSHCPTPEHRAGEVLRVTQHLKSIDGKFQCLRELFQKGEDFSGPVKAKLSDLLHSIFSFLNTYPAVTGDAIHLAIATLIANINGKRWSVFPLGNVTATAFCSVVEGHARVPPAGEVVVLEQEKSRRRISLNLVEKPTPESSINGCCPLI